MAEKVSQRLEEKVQKEEQKEAGKTAQDEPIERRNRIDQQIWFPWPELGREKLE